MISAKDLALLWDFLMGIVRIMAIPLGAAILAIVFLRRKKANR